MHGEDVSNAMPYRVVAVTGRMQTDSWRNYMVSSDCISVLQYGVENLLCKGRCLWRCHNAHFLQIRAGVVLGVRWYQRRIG